MKKIPLTQGKFAIVDDDMFDELNQFKWCALKIRSTFYACRKVTGKTKKSGQRTLYMHRIVLGAKKGELVDHINRDGLKNQRKNLRVASPSLNGLNSRTKNTNASGFRGVYRKMNRWEASIRVNNKKKYLGYFKTPEEASKVYQKAFKIRMKELTI